jgi:hypothetical protein
MAWGANHYFGEGVTIGNGVLGMSDQSGIYWGDNDNIYIETVPDQGGYATGLDIYTVDGVSFSGGTVSLADTKVYFNRPVYARATDSATASATTGNGRYLTSSTTSTF